MNTNYNVEVYFSYNKLTDEQMDIKAKEIANELSSLAKEFNGDLTAYDEDIAFGTEGFERLGINHNYEFDNFELIKNYIQKLPDYYKIIWINKYNKVAKEVECVVYSSRRKPESSKFDDNDKELFKIMIDKLKQN
jgi:hypothetical protein